MTAEKFTVGFMSHKNAEGGSRGKAYLARLTPGPRGSLSREFAKVEKRGDNRRAFRATAVPGDVFEGRRWHWDDLRCEYTGGTIWFGVQSDGTLFMLTRDEAAASVHAVRVDSHASTTLPEAVVPRRMVPDDLRICRADATPLADIPSATDAQLALESPRDDR